MAGPQGTRHLGSAERIYKNSSDAVIAIDSISIDVDERRIPSSVTRSSATTSFHLSAYTHHQRQLFYLGAGDRIIAEIQMIGDFSSLTVDSGDYLTLTWVTPENTNDVTVSLNHLAKIGETL